MILNSSLESVNSESAMLVEGNTPGTMISRPGDYFKTGPRMVSEITKRLAKRIKNRSENGLPATTDTIPSSSYIPRHGSSFDDSLSCISEAETEVRNNLTRNYVGRQASSVDSDLAQEENWNSESLAESRDFCAYSDLFRKGDDSSEPGNEVRVEPKVLITICDGEVELLYSTAALMKEFYTSDDMPSLADSSSSSSSSSSKASNSSTSSQGILLLPKRAVGAYDPFGNSDFSIPSAAKPQRRVHFSNMCMLNEKSALSSILEAQASGRFSSDWSDDSSTSFEYLMNWCGGGYSSEEEI